MKTLKKSLLDQVVADHIIMDDYDYDNHGNTIKQYKEIGRIIECRDFNIECDINVSETYKITSASHYSPEEANSIGSGIYIENFRVITDENEITDPELLDMIYNEYLRKLDIS